MKIIECPRDAMQGLEHFVPTNLKIEYINALLKVGFDTMDFGSFVSPKAVPQMMDTEKVLGGLKTSKSKLLAIVANKRGIDEAINHSSIQYLGFPLSVSEEFQQRNTKRSIEEAFEVVQYGVLKCNQHNKELVVYLSMAFGNPYKESYGEEKVLSLIDNLKATGVRIVSLADTVGKGDSQLINDLLKKSIESYPTLEIGAHLHCSPQKTEELVHAVIDSGCARIDGALGGFGGCPFADDDLVGNLDTMTIIKVCEEKGIAINFNEEAIYEAKKIAEKVFSAIL